MTQTSSLVGLDVSPYCVPIPWLWLANSQPNMSSNTISIYFLTLLMSDLKMVAECSLKYRHRKLLHDGTTQKNTIFLTLPWKPQILKYKSSSANYTMSTRRCYGKYLQFQFSPLLSKSTRQGFSIYGPLMWFMQLQYTLYNILLFYLMKNSYLI